jgi:hypothetical protein
MYLKANCEKDRQYDKQGQEHLAGMLYTHSLRKTVKQYD